MPLDAPVTRASGLRSVIPTRLPADQRFTRARPGSPGDLGDPGCRPGAALDALPVIHPDVYTLLNNRKVPATPQWAFEQRPPVHRQQAAKFMAPSHAALRVAVDGNLNDPMNTWLMGGQPFRAGLGQLDRPRRFYVRGATPAAVLPTPWADPACPTPSRCSAGRRTPTASSSPDSTA